MCRIPSLLQILFLPNFALKFCCLGPTQQNLFGDVIFIICILQHGNQESPIKKSGKGTQYQYLPLKIVMKSALIPYTLMN